ncbi:hypothetical protein N7495_005341 [Penicillium taxi]|uniref:uncharacterized protein n=1 Tax=Penicillium taxi TaxID=168475 RepID=UPI00254566B2|nr:uncharacterized protein N7495_005341 [Penicillium taxi]KAJ5893650.1 hypothetical protein N7495_005341 [Penicillium taxi]
MAERSGQLLAPATPTYVLRGHSTPIHALHIFSQNLRLISGDADGWIVIWDLVTKRPVTVWKAHRGAVLEVKGFSQVSGGTEIYTHGRDHKLCVWRIRLEDEPFLDKTLPVEAFELDKERLEKRAQPWLLHSLPVNALNFCAFSIAFIDTSGATSLGNTQKQETSTRAQILFAVPNAMDSGGIDIFHLPSERRVTTIKSDPAVQTGMLMAVSIFVGPLSDLYVASAYEDGQVMVFTYKEPLTSASFEASNISSNPWKWERIYVCRPHSQPVLSIDVAPTCDYFISSSADALIIKHPIPGPVTVDDVPIVNYMEESPLKTIDTKHSGQQGIRIRNDGKIFATAGWDSRVRVYSAKTMKELAVLKWHKDGCYCIVFGEINPTSQSTPSIPSNDTGTEWTIQQPDQQIVQARSFSLTAIQNQRSQKVQHTHWLAAGSKDGKISLWDIY